jgi:hypothetical protein
METVPRRKLVLNPRLLDKGLPPVFVPDTRAYPQNRYQAWADTWRYEHFQLQIWREFRELTGAWPLASIFLYELGWLIIVLSIVVGLIFGVHQEPLSCVITLAAGAIVFFSIRVWLTDAVLLSEWRRSEHHRRERANTSGDSKSR